MLAKELEQAMAKHTEKIHYLNTGSTLLNLALSNKAKGGFQAGKGVLLVGDSDSGKTFLSLTCMAEASIDPYFKNHKLIYDGPEDGALMDFGRFFGKKAANRIKEPPRGTSHWIEDFYFNAEQAFTEGPCIYVLDSMDVLDSKSARKKFDELRTEFDGGKDAKGDFGDGKAKYNSRNYRKLVARLTEHNSILIIINQSRDNIPDNPMDREKKTRAGGRALKFYSRTEIWTAPGGEIKRTYRGKERSLGIYSRITVKKNHQTGQRHKLVIPIPIYHSYGIDDVGSCVDYLVSEGDWKKPKGGNKITAPDLDVEMDREKLIRYIEDEGLFPQVQELVEGVWWDIQDALCLDRKPKYE